MRELAARLPFALLLPSLAACGGASMQGELLYRAEAAEGGGAPTAGDLTQAAMRVESRVRAFGIAQVDVSPIPPDRVRVVIPESEAGRIDDLRVAIEAPDGLPVRLTLLRRGSE